MAISEYRHPKVPEAQRLPVLQPFFLLYDRGTALGKLRLDSFITQLPMPLHHAMVSFVMVLLSAQ